MHPGATRSARQIIMISLKRASKSERKLIRKIQAAVSAGQRERARVETKRYLRSHAPKVCAVHRASRKVRAGLEIEQINAIAEQLDTWTGSEERAIARPLVRDDGRIRLTCRYGLENRALQALISRVLDAHTPDGTNRYERKGRGRNRAAQEIIRLIIEESCLFVMVADIVDCYPSFNIDRMGQLLPLPRRVTQSVVARRPRNLLPTRRTRHVPQLGYRRPRTSTEANSVHRMISGLPQGSAASPFIERFLLGDALSVSDRAYLLGYADDYVALSTSEDDVCEVQNSLQAYLNTHPAGSFALRSEVARTSAGFTFLGYKFKRCTIAGQPDCYVDLPEYSFRKLYRKLCEAAEEDARNEDPSTPVLRAACKQMFSTHSCLSWGSLAASWVQQEVELEIIIGGRRIRAAVALAIRDAKRAARTGR